MEKVLVSCVAYLNSKPYLRGLQSLAESGLIELHVDPPKVCAERIMNGEVEIGLIPVASIPQLPHHRIISNLGIGADGAVGSVMLYSNCPLDQITEILLDYESMTSVNLCRILCREHWKIKPIFNNASTGYERQINGTVAGVVIGDRAISLRNKYKYTYDLPLEWKHMTGLPFVFACWVSTKELEADFLISFQSALESGLNQKEAIIEELESDGSNSSGFVREYFTEKLIFHLTEHHFEGLKLFWNHLKHQ